MPGLKVRQLIYILGDLHGINEFNTNKESIGKFELQKITNGKFDSIH